MPSAAPVAHAPPWFAGAARRARELLFAYLPLLLMALLALATWWLVKSSPQPGPDVEPAPARHEPDYLMTNFLVQRFASNGALRVQIEGDTLRHFPDTDTLEIDNPRIRAIGADGRITLASAKRALANGDASEVQLLGGASVLREASGNDAAIEFHGEFLHALANTERLRSHRPVLVRRGASELRADGLDYDNLARTLDLKGRMRARFTPPPAR